MSMDEIKGQINSIKDIKSNTSQLKSIRIKSNIKIKSKKIKLKKIKSINN
jgi:hypothetical protein